MPLASPLSYLKIDLGASPAFATTTTLHLRPASDQAEDNIARETVTENIRHIWAPSFDCFSSVSWCQLRQSPFSQNGTSDLSDLITDSNAFL